MSSDDDKMDARDALALAIHDKLAGRGNIDDAALVKAAQALVGKDIPLVINYAKILGIEVDPVRVVDMEMVSNLAHKTWKPGYPLPPGNYEVAIIHEGQDNVVLTTLTSLPADRIAEVAQKKWREGNTVVLGNEWQESREFVIKPIIAK